MLGIDENSMRKNDHLIEPFLGGLPGSEGKKRTFPRRWVLIGVFAALALMGLLLAVTS